MNKGELRSRANQDFDVNEHESLKEFDIANKARVEEWLADLLFQDFIERKGLAK